MARDRPKELLLSRELRGLAKQMERKLARITGEARTPFLMIVQVDRLAQYVANVPRAHGADMIAELLARWKAGLPDIPEHEKH